ncbi:hypothetical protein DYQ86_02220 [Acidobacteria bacterium AB60]|nr:hypothetical protein DYQ86_02220 [Acidobacteria bacterium AB60]
MCCAASRRDRSRLSRKKRRRKRRMSSRPRFAPPDQEQRELAIDPRHSVLVQAPAGSGKTDLLTRRFLRLLAGVDDASQVVAITFTKAAASEMRHRILSEIEKAAGPDTSRSDDDSSIEALARRALQQSRLRGWDLLDLPNQLRISTIDAFCRELAIQQPLLSGLGRGLDIAEQPRSLYRRAARRTLEELGSPDDSDASFQLKQAIETLLLWRDNNWTDLEEQLVDMLGQRDRWMQDFVLESEQEWGLLRANLEGPFVRAVTDALERLESMFATQPGALEEATSLACFACAQSGGVLHRDLAEAAEFPCGPFPSSHHLEEARLAWTCVANLLLTKDGRLRRSVNKTDGFPPGSDFEKQRLSRLANALATVDGVEAALAGVGRLPSAGYAEEEWQIVRASFLLLRRAAAELKVIFAESGKVDYIEVAQSAQRILAPPGEWPSDTALSVADGIHHLLVDEFQDTSRRQHKLIASLVAAWPDPAGRTVFVVGDPMQSIYFFRDADAELFPRVKNRGLDLPTGDAHFFRFAPLLSNFRTAPQLVEKLNTFFEDVFRLNDGSGVRFSSSSPMRGASTGSTHFTLHLDFIPKPVSSRGANARQEREAIAKAREDAQIWQTRQIVSLIRRHRKRMQTAQARGEKYRIAVLGRTRASLAAIAQALRHAGIPFRAVDLEPLAERQEVLDVLALARALLNGEDRVAWLGVLRAPWCGLSLKDICLLTGADDPALVRAPIPALLEERKHLLSFQGQRAVARVLDGVAASRRLRSSLPTATIGTWLKSVWQQLGGAQCVTPAALVNVNLLWKCLDALPGGEPDLLGASLDTALASLTAQPDPDAASEHGVQLMTIHKAKGLEFEVVVVPEMQSPTARGARRMLTWLERGLEQPEHSDEVTEFLIAPMQPRGGDRGRAKRWVDAVYRQRETQEIRRILYVAATRAREELHFFARPEFRSSRSGELALARPRESLLSTAWPALAEEIESRFATWKDERQQAERVSLAAAEESRGSNLIQMALPLGSVSATPSLLRRLPFDYAAPEVQEGPSRTPRMDPGSENEDLYERHEGGSASRALGFAVHAYFEELARLHATMTLDAARASLAQIRPRIAAQIRAAGHPHGEAERIADESLQTALRATHDPLAAWFLAPRPGAGAETRWTGMIGGSLRTLRVDRVFQAGNAPLAPEDGTWWIVDYKTAISKGQDPEQTVRAARPLFAPQLEIYAQVLRNLHGAGTRVHAGLYYPRMLLFDWWEIRA